MEMQNDNMQVDHSTQYLFERNVFKRLFYRLRNRLRDWIRDYRFPYGKVIFLAILAIIVTSIVFIVKRNMVEISPRAPYDKTGFIFADSGDLTNTDRVIENDRFEFHFDEMTTHFYILDKLTGKRWDSNPKEYDNHPGITNSSRNNQNNIISVSYHLSIGTVNTIYSYEFSTSRDQFGVRYNDQENSIEVLYIIGNLGIDYTDLPQRLGKERFEELILNRIPTDTFELQRRRRFVENSYSYVPQQEVYVLKNPENLSENAIAMLYEAIFELAGYTKEDLDYDHRENKVSLEDTKPYFEVSVKYQLTDNGFEITIINDSIYEKPNFPMVYIDVLPNFGTASVNDEGYIFVPDGSGSLIRFNNGKTYTRPYQKRVYGVDHSILRHVSFEEVESINIPVYGMKKNDGAFLAIIKEGAPMATIIADISQKYDSYNRVYPRFNYREMDKMSIASWNKRYEIDMWTRKYNTNDYTVEYQFTSEEHDYIGMANLYRNHLIENGLKQRDQTDHPILNLSLLGGYEETEHFVGIPYSSVKELTSTEHVKEIIKELKEDGVDQLNIHYVGWMNGGISHQIPTDIKLHKAIGKQKDFTKLFKYAEEQGVAIYPEISMVKVNGNSKFDPKDDGTRAITGDIVTHYPYNLATKLPDRSQTPVYILNPYSYESVANRFIKEYSEMNHTALGLSDLGSIVNGTYKNQQFAFRDLSLEKQVEALNVFDQKLRHISFRNPFDFAFSYSDNIMDLSVKGSDYFIIDEHIPFVQLVLSGLVEYAGKAFNIEDAQSMNWHKMKAIESGSNLNFTWSYKDTFDLINTQYNQFYSTYYKNWYHEAVSMYHELDGLGIYGSRLVHHEILAPDVRKVTYSNGVEIVLNYGISDYRYGDIVVKANDYTKIKGAN